MKNELKKYLIQALIIFAATTLGYYVFYIRPKMRIPSKIVQIEKTISIQYQLLLTNRVSLVSLTRLDPNSIMLITDKEKLTNEISESREEALKSLRNAIMPDLDTSLPNESIKFLKELDSRTKELLKNNEEILTRQEEVLSSLSSTDKLLKDIFQYDPILDISLLDVSSEKDKIITRASNASKGLTTIRDNLDNVEVRCEQYDELQQTISNEIILFNELTEDLTNEQKDSSMIMADIISSFNQLRKVGLDCEKGLIRSPEMITLITDQTNLLLEYKFWMEKIDKHQADTLSKNEIL